MNITRKQFVALSAGAAVSGLAFAQSQQKSTPAANTDLGYTDTPMLPNQPWHVHDPARPHPRVITPASTPGGAPSDAIVLFDGRDTSHWVQAGKGDQKDTMIPAKVTLGDGFFAVIPRGGDLLTREKFGDIQLHIEWASPDPPTGNSQNRGNSGIKFMTRYELQVLDAWNNPTYADGQASAIYGQYPPLVNPARKPGEWNVYDVVFEAPKFESDKLVKPAFLTVFYNGVMVHNRKELIGTTLHRQVGKYTAHSAEEPLLLQDHQHPVRYRNIWIRRLRGYDEVS